jgi:hypothetical protein
MSQQVQTAVKRIKQLPSPQLVRKAKLTMMMINQRAAGGGRTSTSGRICNTTTADRESRAVHTSTIVDSGAQAGRHSTADSRRRTPRIAEDGRRPPQHRKTLATAPCPSATEAGRREGCGSLCFCPMAIAGNFNQTLRGGPYLVG